MQTVFDILVAIFGLFVWIKWLLTAKGTPYRKYILLWGLCLIIAGSTYIGVPFDIWPLALISIVASIGFWYFLIKAMIAEHKYKKQSSKNKI